MSTTALSAPEVVALQAPPPPPELLRMTGVTVTKVAIEGGRLIVEGKTAKPKTTVTIDRRSFGDVFKEKRLPLLASLQVAATPKAALVMRFMIQPR